MSDQSDPNAYDPYMDPDNFAAWWSNDLLPKELKDPRLQLLCGRMHEVEKAVDRVDHTLQRFVARTNDLLDTQVIEIGKGAGGTFSFDAQTDDLEIITGFYAQFPLTAQNITLTFGMRGDAFVSDVQLPLPAGFSNVTDMNLIIRTTHRTVTWDDDSTDPGFICLFGYTASKPGSKP